MSCFSNVNRRLNIDVTSARECQDYLDQAHSRESDPYCANAPIGVIEDILSLVNSKGFAMATDDVASGKKLLACLLSSIVHASTSTDELLSAIAILRVGCSTAGYGMINSNMLNIVLTSLIKVLTKEIKSSANRTRRSERSAAAVLDKEPAVAASSTGSSFEPVPDEGTRKSSRIATVNSQNDEEDMYESDPEEEDEILMTQTQNTVMNADGTTPVYTFLPISIKLLNMLVQTIASKNVMAMLYTLREDHIVAHLSETLCACAFLCNMCSEFSNFQDISISNAVTFAMGNELGAFTIIKSLLPTLTLAPRNPLLPDIFKVKSSSHKSAVKIVIQMLSGLQKQQPVGEEEVVAAAAQTTAVGTTTDETSSEETNADTDIDSAANNLGVSAVAATSDTSTATISPIDMPEKNVYVLGAMQRMMVNSPDRSAVRTLVVDSLSQIMLLCAEAPSTESMLRSFIGFMVRLCSSNKIGHRAFSVELAACLLSGNRVDNHWVWSKASQIAGSGSVAMQMLHMLLSRCNDASPAVRMRSLTAISDLMEALHEESPAPMIACMFDLAMGVAAQPSQQQQHDPGSTVVISLIDTLRALTVDEKPMVRSKALQALGLALSMQWPKPCQQQSSNFLASDSATAATTTTITSQEDVTTTEMLSLLVTEEDLAAISQRCGDSSISARRSALVALSSILRSRPIDATVQSLWLSSVLPLACDDESSIVAKVAEMTHLLLFDPMCDWYVNNKASTASVPVAKASNTDASLSFLLCHRIAEMNLSHLLRTAVTAICKQGLLKLFASKTMSGSRSSNSLLFVFEALRFACSFENDSISISAAPSAAASTASTLFGGKAAMDSADVSLGAWVLLESIVSQSNDLQLMCINSANVTTMTTIQKIIAQAGSAEFAVKYFKEHLISSSSSATFSTSVSFASNANTHGQSHLSNSYTTRTSSEKLRVLKVLQKLACNLGPDSVAFMQKELMKILHVLHNNDAQIVSCAVAVMYELSKTKAATNTSDDDNEAKIVWDDIKSWASELVVQIHSKIRHMIFPRDRKTAVALDDPSVLGALFLLGELCMLGFALEEDERSLTVSVPPQWGAAATDTAATGAATAAADFDIDGPIESVLGYSCGTGLKHFKLKIPEKLVELLQLLMGVYLPACRSAEDKEEDVGVRECPAKLRAIAFIGVGKLCIRDRALARKNINVFLREISVSAAGSTNLNITTITNASSGSSSSSSSSSSAARCNALLVLGDLCVRYTNLVDRHIDTMAMCLHDSDINIKRNTVLLISQLLQQDFIKWRGFLLYQFLALTSDNNRDVCEYTRNLLKKSLAVKFPDLLHKHFTETLLLFNSCVAHPVVHSIVSPATSAEANSSSAPDQQSSSNSSSSSDANVATASTSSANGGEGVELVLPAGIQLCLPMTAATRLDVYSFMCADAADEVKIQLSAKLVQDVLAYVVDHPTVLPNRRSSPTASKQLAPMESAIQDALKLLCSPMLKVGKKMNANAEDGDEDIDSNVAGGAGEAQPAVAAAASTGGKRGAAAAAMAKAKVKVLTVLSTQHLINHVLPVVISLKHCLEAAKSPLQGPLMSYLVHLVKTNKQEVNAYLMEDPILRAEIDYEIKQFDRAQQAQQLAQAEAEAASAAARVLAGARNSLMGVGGNVPMAPATLRKSLGGGVHSNRQTPKQAIRSAVSGSRTDTGLVMSVQGALQQVLSTAKKAAASTATATSGRRLSSVSFGQLNNDDEDDEEGDAAADDVERLLTGITAAADFVQDENIIVAPSSPFEPPAKRRNSSRGSVGGGSSLFLRDDDDEGLSSSKGNSNKRRSWSVVVGGQLNDATATFSSHSSSPSASDEGSPHQQEASKENSGNVNSGSGKSSSGATPAKKKGRGMTKKGDASAATAAAAEPVVASAAGTTTSVSNSLASMTGESAAPAMKAAGPGKATRGSRTAGGAGSSSLLSLI